MNKINDILRRAWLNHVMGEEHFPRDMFFLARGNKKIMYGKKRPVARTFEHLVNSALSLFGRANIYTGVYCHKCLSENKYNKVYFDLDKDQVPLNISERERLEIAYRDMRKLSSVFPTNVYFTGYGGFAVYIAFEPIKLKHPKETLRAFVEYLREEFNLLSVDPLPIGDIRRVSRLPYTVNLKNERLCIPIDPNWDLDYILKQSKKCNDYVLNLYRPSSVARYMLSGYDKKMSKIIKKEKEEEINIDHSKFSSVYEKEIYDIIKWGKLVYEAIKDWDGRHRVIWRIIIPRAIFLGWSLEKTLEVCRKFIEETGRDWSEYKNYCTSTYKRTLQRIRENKPITYSLSRLFMENPDLLKYYDLRKILGEGEMEEVVKI